MIDVKRKSENFDLTSRLLVVACHRDYSTGIKGYQTDWHLVSVREIRLGIRNLISKKLMEDIFSITNLIIN